MKIKDIYVINNGYIHCRSVFYASHDILNKSEFHFTTGINKLNGEIDSGNWAISYLLSMYKYRPKDFILFEQPQALLNNERISLEELSKFSCYMDIEYPLFSKNTSVRKLVTRGLKDSKLNYSCDDIKNLFQLDNERFERPLKNIGNDIFRAMAAIGFSYNKQIFCFPWLSKIRFEGYHKNLTWLLQTLEDLEKIVIVPLGDNQGNQTIDNQTNR